jgi:hypothetical protein
MIVTLPSGLAFNARKWKIGDRRLIHDKKLIKQGVLTRRMLEAVDLGVEECGPYTELAKGEKVNWSHVYIGDIVDALIGIRIATKPKIAFVQNCPNCGKRNPFDADLRDLESSPMPEEGIKHLSTSSPLEIRVQNHERDCKVNLKMLRGVDMPMLAKWQKQGSAEAEEAQSVLHIERVEDPSLPEPLTATQAIWTYFKDADWDFQEAIDEKITQVAGGVDTRIEADCKFCSVEFTTSIPFGPEFFYPQKNSNTSFMGT